MINESVSVGGEQSQALRPKFRAYAAVLGVGISVTLGWVAYMETGFERLVSGLLCIAFAAATEEGIRRETVVVQNCMSATGTITYHRPSRRGAEIHYRFNAFSGREYDGKSLWSVRGMSAGGKVIVVYKALDPSVNLPLRGFLFYTFGQSSGVDQDGGR